MKIGFISKKGAVRALLAEAITRELFKKMGIKAEVYSAGLEPEKNTPKEVLEVLKEKGYSIKSLYPKPLRKIPYKSLDVLVILDNEIKERCPFEVYHKRRENLHIEEPKSLTLTELRKLRDKIEEELKKLFGVNKEVKKKVSK